MIRLCNPMTAEIPEDSEAGVRIASLRDTYGDRPAVWRLYAGEGGSLLAVCGQTAVLLPGEDAEEAALFASMDPELRTVRTDAETAGLLRRLDFRACRTGEVLCRSAGVALPAPDGARAQSVRPDTLYPLLTACFPGELPPYDVWYADVFYRVRRGRCRAAAVLREEGAVSAALTVAETAHSRLIGGVATLSAYRGRGYASACVAALAAAAEDVPLQQNRCRLTETAPEWQKLQSAGSDAAAGPRCLLAPREAALIPWYVRLGFAPCGTWGEAVR